MNEANRYEPDGPVQQSSLEILGRAASWYGTEAYPFVFGQATWRPATEPGTSGAGLNPGETDPEDMPPIVLTQATLDELRTRVLARRGYR